MPLPIPVVDRDKQPDDPWTVEDANAPIRASERIETAGRLEHNRFGDHLLPAAEAAAMLEYAGGSYNVVWSHNIESIVRIGTGLVEVELTNQMRSAQHVGLIFNPAWEGITGAVQGDTTSTTVRFQIVDQAGNPIDFDGLVLIFGERLNP